MYKKVLSIIMFFLLLMVMVGCIDTTSNTTPSTTKEDTGNLVLSIVDAPGDYEEVHINIVKTFIKSSEGEKEWELLGDFTDSPIGMNLLDYRIKELNLPTADLPTGNYNEIRFVLDNTGYIKLEGDPTHYPLVVGELEEPEDSEEENDEEKNEKNILGDDEQAIDIEYPFQISNSAITNIQIDFNVAKMVKLNEDTVEQDYILDTKEISAIDKAEAGEIEGKVGILDSATNEIIKVPTKVTVSLYDSSDTTYSTPITTTWAIEEEMEDEDEEDKRAEPGKFKLRGISAGNYSLVITAEGYQQVEITDLVIEEETEIEFENEAEDKEDEDNEENEESNDDSTNSYNIIGGTLIEEYIILQPIAN